MLAPVQTEAIHVACCDTCLTQASSALSLSTGIGLPDPGTSTRSGAVSESSVLEGDTTRPASALTGSDQIERRELVIEDKCDLHSVPLSVGIEALTAGTGAEPARRRKQRAGRIL